MQAIKDNIFCAIRAGMRRVNSLERESGRRSQVDADRAGNLYRFDKL